MKRRDLVLFGLVLIFLISLFGCTGVSRLEKDFGNSFKLAKFNQILDPEAEKNLEPVTGFDEKAAQATIEKYRKGFEEKPPAPVYNIGIGATGK